MWRKKKKVGSFRTDTALLSRNVCGSMNLSYTLCGPACVMKAMKLILTALCVVTDRISKAY